MKLIRFLKGQRRAWQSRSSQRRVLRQFAGPADEISAGQWPMSLQEPTTFYLQCFHYFHTRLPEPLRAHRDYFTRNRRGFGEDAFHTMWFLLFREFQPQDFMEIGVFRGQTLSLAALLARLAGLSCQVQGISPFSAAGDAVSKYRENVDYHADTLKNFTHFSLPKPALLKSYSTDPAARELIASRQWSLVYIDGNHDYEVARQDWELCSQNVKPGGIIVLDDAGLTTSFQPPPFATGGHPGPSRLAQEIDRGRFREILQVGHNRVFQKIAG
jgi:hypothetical protein